MKIDIKAEGMKAVRRALEESARQVPFALSKALTDTAFKVRAELQGAMRQTFDRPTPWLVRQVRVQPATKQSLEAVVGSPESIKGGFGVLDKILVPHVFGGARVAKPVELALRAKGWLPEGWSAVPGPGVKLDQYGNLSRAMWKRLQALNGTKRTELFIAREGHARGRRLHPGIWERSSRGAIRPLVLFVPTQTYRAVLDWYGMAHRTVQQAFGPAFDKAWAAAMRTAR